MKKYLIEIRTTCGGLLFTTINGDMPSCPFCIGNCAWAYMTPGHAARRLELLAKGWEKRGRTVERIYGTIADMKKSGNADNVIAITQDWNK